MYKINYKHLTVCFLHNCQFQSGSPVRFNFQLILVFALAACHTEEKKQEVKQKFSLTDKMLSTTTTEAVTMKPLKNELNFYGKITADNSKMIEVFPVVGGNVTKVFEIGRAHV